MTYSLDEAEQLVKLVEKTGRVFALTHNYEENGLTLRVYASKGAIKWAQENPNYLEVYRYGERQIMTRGQGYLSPAAATRIPTGHPEGYLEAFATIYTGVIEAIRRYIDGHPTPRIRR